MKRKPTRGINKENTGNREEKIPRMVKQTRPISAIPRKRSLLNKAYQYTPELAICELIDNCYDNWVWNGKNRNLNIKINMIFDKSNRAKQINIEDDSGGVPDERLEALVRLGEENPNPDAIGIWGEGMKVATHSLGRDIKIYTRYGNDPAYCLYMDEKWIESDSWDVPRYEAEGVLPATTNIIISKLNHRITKSEILSDTRSSLFSKLQFLYGYILASNQNGNRINITLSDGKIEYKVEPNEIGTEKAISNSMAFPPGFEPSIHTKILRKDEKKLKIRAIVGLSPEQQRDYSGVTMFGKGRLFEFAKKEYSVGFGTRGRAKIPASHPTTWRLHVYMFFDGDSSLIPWSSPAKWGYNENNLFQEEIHDFISKITIPYASFTRVAKRIDLLPFSAKWNEYNEDERKNELKKYFEDEGTVNDVWETYEAFKEYFKPPENLISWNHDSSDQPPDKSPKFSKEKSKAIARLINRRDKKREIDFIDATREILRASEGYEITPLSIPKPSSRTGEKDEDRSGEIITVSVKLTGDVVDSLMKLYQNMTLSEILTHLAKTAINSD